MSPTNNNRTASTFTDAERAKLVEFRKRVQKIYPKPDEQLIIWLRARGLNVAKAEQMLRKNLVWRKNNQIDSMRSWRGEKNYAPYIHLGYDYEGAPVFLFPFGRYEIRGIIEAGDIVGAFRCLFQAIEICMGIAHAQNKTHGILILDGEGFRYHQYTNRFLIQAALELGRIVEANYPELLKTGFVINAPRLFNVLFGIIKPVLASQTISKIQVHGFDRSKWLAAMKKQMSLDILPPYWGGTRPGSDEFCSDDWAHEPLPRYFMRRLDSVFDDYGQEWISLKIAAGEQLTFEYTISEEELHRDPVLSWAFYTDGYDLAFGFDHEDEELIGMKRVNSHKGKQSGSQLLSKPGKYVLKFDNTYSRTRSKVLHYVISLTAEDESDGPAIIVRTPCGSTRALNDSSNGSMNGSSISSNGMATLGVPGKNYLNGSHSSIASSASCCSCGSSMTNLNGAGEDDNEKEFLDAVDDLKIDPYLQESDNNKTSSKTSKSKSIIKSFF